MEERAKTPTLWSYCFWRHGGSVLAPVGVKQKAIPLNPYSEGVPITRCCSVGVDRLSRTLLLTVLRRGAMFYCSEKSALSTLGSRKSAMEGTKGVQI